MICFIPKGLKGIKNGTQINLCDASWDHIDRVNIFQYLFLSSEPDIDKGENIDMTNGFFERRSHLSAFYTNFVK